MGDNDLTKFPPDIQVFKKLTVVSPITAKAGIISLAPETLWDGLLWAVARAELLLLLCENLL